MKQFIFRVLPIIAILSASIMMNAPGIPFAQDTLSANALTNGSIAGIDYSYGTNEYFASGNFTHVENGTISETVNETKSATRTLPLITSSVLSDLKIGVNGVAMTSDNRYYLVFQESFSNDTYYSNYTDSVFNVMAARYDSGNLTHGQELMNIEFHENVTTADTYIESTTGDFLGKYPTGVYRLDYNYKYLNGTEVRRFDFIYNQVLIFEIQTQDYAVDMTQTNFAFAYIGYYMRYSNEYNVSATAHQVNITDGENFALGVSMFDRIEANYTEYILSYIGYVLISYQVTELKFTNGTTVPWEMYPRNLLPISYTTQGSKVEVGYRHSETKLLSTFQNIAAVFAAFNENITENSASLEANLAIWNLQTSTTMAAYTDGNQNGRLDLSLGVDSLEVASSDRVDYLGLAEAYSTTTINAHYSSHVYNESLVQYGLGVNITNINVNDTVNDPVSVVYEGFGDVNAATTSTFSWVTPKEETDGTVVFEFGVDYNNFPVTWVNLRDGSIVYDQEDLGYHYIVKVDPETGKARISGTWTYGGIENIGLKNAVSGLSLATIVKSEFLAISASYTATTTNEELNRSRTKEVTRIGVRVGGGVATEIGVDGPKQFYLLNGVNQTANFDAINILIIRGSFEAERTTVFSSESGNTAGLSTVNGIVEKFNVELFYSASLIVVSYPEWGGEDIVHDPDYDINYQPNVRPDIESSSPTTESVPSSNPQEKTSSSENTGKASLPIAPFSIIIPLFVVMVYFKRKRNS